MTGKSALDDDDSTEFSLVDIEARLIEQDHRLFQVAKNFIFRKKWETHDPRRTAAISAVLWQVFSPATAAIAGSTAVAIASLIFAVMQTRSISEQTQLMSKQFVADADGNKRQRETELTEMLFPPADSPSSPYGPRTRQAALHEYMFVGADKNIPNSIVKNLDGIDLSGMWVKGSDIGNVSLRNAKLTGTKFHSFNDNYIVIAGKIDSLSIDNSSFSEFLCFDCQSVDLSINNVTFQRFFYEGNIVGSNFRNVKIKTPEYLGLFGSPVSFNNVKFDGVDMRFTDFGSSEFTAIKIYRPVNIYGANLTPKARRYLLSVGAVEIEDDQAWLDEVCGLFDINSISHAECVKSLR